MLMKGCRLHTCITREINNRHTLGLLSLGWDILSCPHTVRDPCSVFGDNAVQHNRHIMVQVSHTFCKRMLLWFSGFRKDKVYKIIPFHWTAVYITLLPLFKKEKCVKNIEEAPGNLFLYLCLNFQIWNLSQTFCKTHKNLRDWILHIKLNFQRRTFKLSFWTSYP